MAKATRQAQRKARPPEQRRRTRRHRRPGPRRSPRRAWVLVLAAVIVGALSTVGALLTWSFRPAAPPGPPAVDFRVVEGETRVQTIERLHQAGLVESPMLMRSYLRLLAPGVEFRPRAHLLEPGLSPRQLVQRLAEIGERDVGRVTIPEGYNRWQIAERLQERGICGRDAFLRAVVEPVLLRELDVPGPSAEGFLFPATYEFHLDSAAEAVVSRLVAENRKRVGELISRHPPHRDLGRLNFSRRDLLTLASIVEKETGARTERAEVARVFINRLLAPGAETGGRLESDPTAAYGCRLHPTLASCAGFRGVPKPAMLRDPQNPYNTYRHPGLPPGPIANPGEAAIRAVLEPADGEALYFVADGRGRHTFSEDFAAHQKAVRALRTQQTTDSQNQEKSPK